MIRQPEMGLSVYFRLPWGGVKWAWSLDEGSLRSEAELRS
ncbi:hypothetical protein GCWU000324_01948 [Kingella oralis ATCC 51147]|uniref:Uncharacterized protein n=1 Tax=Kingella oralis ATCC 51147 TaxID=629741 RepID=C4GIS7_9NEIS|nr:hypothetical protein GCWU000324_01948 [Kingella oralis ATCC 51147]